MLLQSIETERLHIRPFKADDWPAVYDYMSNPEVTAWLSEGLLDEDGARAFVAENLGDEARNYAVLLRGGERPIGHMAYHPWHGPRMYEVGWVIHPGHQGRGYATEATAALVHHSFTVLDAHRVIATCQPQNPASWRIMEKLGMRREAHFLKCIQRDETTWWDEYFYALLADEWRNQVH